MNINVLNHLIYLVRHGSHAYGLARPISDLDLKGVALPPRGMVLGYAFRFDQKENAEELAVYGAGQNHGTDSVVYGLQKFMKLAADCNPNIIEVLWVDEEDILFCNEIGAQLRGLRKLFVSLKAKHTFAGYAFSQLKRIKTHRRWLLEPPKRKPERTDFGLPENQKLVSGDAMGTIQELGNKGYGFSEELMTALGKEKRYASALSQWKQFENWKATRNPARAELEAKHGYDTKHAVHLVRLLRMCVEILEGKGVIVRRVCDAEELNAVRDGAWSYDKLMGEAERLETKAEELYKANPVGLPHKPDHKKLNVMCVGLHDAAWRSDAKDDR